MTEINFIINKKMFSSPSVFSIPPEVFLSLLSPHVCPEGAHTGQCWRARQCGDAGPGEI